MTKNSAPMLIIPLLILLSGTLTCFGTFRSTSQRVEQEFESPPSRYDIRCEHNFMAKLLDVTPDGSVYNIVQGAFRARYREGFDKKVWMKPDEVYKIEVDLHATSYFYAKGHLIRLDISSSDFPNYERNLNTGGNNYDETQWVVAENKIHHSKQYLSHQVQSQRHPSDRNPLYNCERKSRFRQIRY